jgi:hypothetical protein
MFQAFKKQEHAMGHDNARQLFPADMAIAKICRERSLSHFDEIGSRRLRAA